MLAITTISALTRLAQTVAGCYLPVLVAEVYTIVETTSIHAW